MDQKSEITYVRRELSPVSAIRLTRSNLPEDLPSAYRALRETLLEKTGFGAAWKLGGTTATTRQIFGVDKLYFGALHENEIAVQPRVAPGFPTYELKGEAEIALRLAASAEQLISQGPDAIRRADLETLFDGWCVALELPSSPIVNLIEMGVVALVADRCAAGFLALGGFHEIVDRTSWSKTEIRIEQNAEILTTGSSNQLLSTPDSCARSFILEALEQGYVPRAGQWISTGGATACVPLKRGAQIDVFYGDNREMSFTAETSVDVR